MKLPAGLHDGEKRKNGFKLERFAVLKEFRGKGVGAELVKAVLKDIPEDGSKIYLNAQVGALEFYRNLGFVVIGEVFEEAGIMHRQMVYEG